MSLRKTIILLIICIMVPGGPAFAAASLAWHTNPETTIAGYRVHYRTAFDTAVETIDAGSTTSITFKDLLPETKDFVTLTAYSVYGLESPPSAEFAFYTSPKSPALEVLPDRVKLEITGKAGGTVELYQSSDLKTWSLARTILNPNGTVEVEIPHEISAPRQFFRLASRGDTLAGWLAQQGLSDPSAPFRGGPLSNQFAYSTGADLVGETSNVQPRLGKVNLPGADGTETFATFSYTIREGTSDVTPKIEMSHDLMFWSRAESNLSEISSVLNGDGTRTMTMREATPISENPHRRRFYRLRFDGGTTAPMDYGSWLTLTGALDPDGDHDSDGISNAFAFASGADLLANAQEAMPSIGSVLWFDEEENTTSRYPTFRYHLRDHMTGVTPEIEFTEDLQTWAPANQVTVSHSDVQNNDGTRTITLRETEPGGFHPYRFYRVRYLFSTP